MWPICKRKDDKWRKKSRDDPAVRRADKNFKAIIITMPKDVKENMLLMKEKTGNLSREPETIRKEHDGKLGMGHIF